MYFCGIAHIYPYNNKKKSETVTEVGAEMQSDDLRCNKKRAKKDLLNHEILRLR